MKIAGVSVNIKSLPTEESLIKLALKTKKYIYKRDALKLIKAEIKASGLYKTVRAKSKSTETTKDSSRPNNTKRTKSNKNSKK